VELVRPSSDRVVDCGRRDEATPDETARNAKSFIPDAGRGHDQSAILDAMLLYARNGFHVFPAPPGKKKGVLAAEFSDGIRWGASNDERAIRRNFRTAVELLKGRIPNIGILTGSGFFVLEADTLAGHGVDRIAALEALERQHGKLPETRTGESPSGSPHYYFRHPPGIKISGGKPIAPGVDVCGGGQMVIAPPSIGPIARDTEIFGQYWWRKEIPMAMAPP